MLDSGYIYTGNVFDKKHSIYDDVPWWKVHGIWLILAAIVIVIIVTVLVRYLVLKNRAFRSIPRKVKFYGYEEKDYKYGSYLNPDVPEKDGYAFCGWFRDPAFLEPWKSTDKVKRDITLYPKWEKER